ncbi:MAG: TetR/AcrR family transcriptional regulator [Candidatus Competibacteraceae bacterium]|nr:TetR/AcrR family transcriptional regulator [Candidatus Competibacteraceae bacterium]
MGRRNEHTREELREISLQAAEQLVIAHGLMGLSARKVAAGIGYTVGSLYMVFRNFDDLIIQMNERTLDALYEKLAAAVTNPPSPTAAIEALAQTYLAFALSETNRWLALYEHRMPEGQAAPDSFAEKVARMFELVQQHLASLCPHRSFEEISLAARALWSGIHGVCVLSLDRKLESIGGRTMQQVANSLLDNYLAGFVAQGVSR